MRDVAGDKTFYNIKSLRSLLWKVLWILLWEIAPYGHTHYHDCRPSVWPPLAFLSLWDRGKTDRMHGLEEAMHAREAYEDWRKQTMLDPRARHLCKLQEAERSPAELMETPHAYCCRRQSHTETKTGGVCKCIHTSICTCMQTLENKDTLI